MDEQIQQEIAAQLRKPTGEDGIKTGIWMNSANVHINKDCLDVLQATSGDRILEIGMGNGFFVNSILSVDSSIHYMGCDFAEVMVKEAKRLNAEWITKGQANFILANNSALPFTNHLFNKVFTVNTLYFWDEETPVLNEIKRVLQPGGTLIIAFRPKRQMEHYPFTKYGFNLFSVEDACRLLERNGWVVKQVFENTEPNIEVNGELFTTENVVITASYNQTYSIT